MAFFVIDIFKDVEARRLILPSLKNRVETHVEGSQQHRDVFKNLPVFVQIKP